MEIQTLTNLSWLWFYDNEFTDLPDLSSLTSLVELYIQNNKPLTNEMITRIISNYELCI